MSLAVRHGWAVRALVYDASAVLSQWAEDLLDSVACTRVAMATELIHELGGKSDAPPELVAVVGVPDDRLDRVATASDMLVVLFDRPTSPGNIGTLIRSADAFGAAGVIVTGHAADTYDPKSVRASTGSLFAVPTVRVPSIEPVLEWISAVRERGTEFK